MQQLFLLFSFITGFIIFYSLFSTLMGNRLLMSKRLSEIKIKRSTSDQREEELEKPFYERVINPVLRWISISSAKLAPVKKNTALEQKLLKSGQPLGLKSEEFVAVYYAIMVLSLILGAIIALFRQQPLLGIVLYACLGILVGYALVELWLRFRIRNRIDQISRSLPDVLDLMTVSVEAGLGFDAALIRVVEKLRGPLSTEIGETLQEMKMGRQRRDALRDLGDRTDVDELKTFVSSVIQADQLGVSIGNVLRNQAAQVRMSRRQRVEQKAMKAPIIMLIPMLLFIFPTIFIVVLAPGIIQIVENMK